MADLFGARMTDSQPVGELILKFVKPFGSFQPGDTLQYPVPGKDMKYWGTGLEMTSGEVIAVDQQGRPALVVHKLGAGKTLLSAYPLEAYLGNTVNAFEEPSANYERLFAALRDWSGVQPLVRTDQPGVEAAALNAANRGYIVLVNHGGAARQARIITKLPVHSLKRLDVGGSSAVSCSKDGCNVDVPPYDGVILEWAR